MPSSVSPQARAVLSSAARSPMLWSDYPALSDVEGWRDYVRTADDNMMAMLAPFAARFADIACRTMEIDGARLVHAEGAAAGGRERILFLIHGGALIAGGGPLCELGAAMKACSFDATVYAPDYRMPPDFPFPTPLEDCLAAYRHVAERHSPDRIVLMGSSAGGNLAAALIVKARQEGVAMPGSLVLETPELDLTESGDSFETNAVLDTVLQRRLGPINLLYASGRALDDPLLSPLFADLEGFPRTMLTAGTRDMFLSNAVRMHHRLREANVASELQVYEAMPHGGFFGTPEDERVANDIRRFAQASWPEGHY